jgi:hypothetical protein
LTGNTVTVLTASGVEQQFDAQGTVPLPGRRGGRTV